MLLLQRNVLKSIFLDEYVKVQPCKQVTVITSPIYCLCTIESFILHAYDPGQCTSTDSPEFTIMNGEPGDGYNNILFECFR